MKRSDAIQRLRAHRDQLRQQFGVASLQIFGSTAVHGVAVCPTLNPTT